MQEQRESESHQQQQVKVNYSRIIRDFTGVMAVKSLTNSLCAALFSNGELKVLNVENNQLLLAERISKSSIIDGQIESFTFKREMELSQFSKSIKLAVKTVSLLTEEKSPLG